jgi:hypothetical protein
MGDRSRKERVPSLSFRKWDKTITEKATVGNLPLSLPGLNGVPERGL